MVALTSTLPEPLVLPKAWFGRAGAIPRSEVSRRRRAGSRDREQPNRCLEKETPPKGVLMIILVTHETSERSDRRRCSRLRLPLRPPLVFAVVVRSDQIRSESAYSKGSAERL